MSDDGIDLTTYSGDTHDYTVSEDARPDPTDVEDARCEVAACERPATTACWSREFDTFFRYCDTHAEEKLAQFEDLEVVG